MASRARSPDTRRQSGSSRRSTEVGGSRKYPRGCAAGRWGCDPGRQGPVPQPECSRGCCLEVSRTPRWPRTRRRRSRDSWWPPYYRGGCPTAGSGAAGHVSPTSHSAGQLVTRPMRLIASVMVCRSCHCVITMADIISNIVYNIFPCGRCVDWQLCRLRRSTGK